MLAALLNSFLLVAVAEIGDKTQLLSFVLAARFKRPWPIIWGILIATLLNHALASAVGTSVANYFSPEVQKWGLAAIFLFFAGWILIPDKEGDLNTQSGRGAFFTTLITFFLAEMGDKTQLATVALGAQFHDVLWVTLGTTLGMLAANVPAVFLGEKILKRIPLNTIRKIAAALYLIFAILIAIR